MKSLKPILVLALIATLVSVAAAADQTAAELQREGVRAARQGDPQLGAQLLERCVELYPDYRNLDYVLYNLGDVYENELFDFVRACDIYKELIERFPSSRWALRGRNRLEQLEENDLYSDSEPLALLKSIRRDYRDLGRDRVVEQYLTLLHDFPLFSKRDEALFGLAQEYELRALPEDDEREYLKALEMYRRLVEEKPGSDLAFVALKQSGDILLELNRFDEARQEYARMASYRGEDGANAARFLSLEVDKYIRLRNLYLVCLGLIAALSALLIKRVRWSSLGRDRVLRALIEPGLLLLASIGGAWYLLYHDRPVRYLFCMLLLMLGFAVTLFCNALYIGTRRLSAMQILFQAVVVMLLVTAVIYAVFYGLGLMSITIQTLQSHYYIISRGG
ncbi:MAG: tetratricopeptide repeat protein [Candidatus Alcyoniella australis]|nr:tetratricopeptide repeat protein [Candidatus Alcyoniella australis]